MGLDPLSIVAPARVKILLLPLAHVTAARFLGFVDRLRQEDVVRLGDVSPDGRPHRTMFSPLAFPAGSILYDISTSAPLPSHSALSPFELYREPLVIIGISDGSDCCTKPEKGLAIDGEANSSPKEDGSSQSLHQDLLEELGAMKGAYSRAFVHHIFLFDHVKTEAALPEGITTVPNRKSSKITTMRTIMCDLTAQLLGEMTTFAKSLQALPSIESPPTVLNSPATNGAGTLDASRLTAGVRGSRPVSPTKNDPKSQNRISLPVILPSDSKPSVTGEFQERARSPPSRVQSPATTFDEIAGPQRLVSPSRKIAIDSGQQSIERLSMQGFGSGGAGERERMKGKGRVGVVIGAMYLLAGRWPDAIKELAESANILRANSDYLWIAKALDYILVTLLMYAWAGMDFKVPQVLYPGIDKTSSGPNKGTQSSSSQDTSAATPSRLVSMQNLTNLLPDLVNNIINLYVRTWTLTDDKTPVLVFSESVIRFCKLMTCIHLNHGSLDDRGLRQMLFNEKASQGQPSKEKHSPFPSKAEITTILFRSFPSPSSEEMLSVSDRTVILAGISSVLSDLGYHRKKALVLKELASTLLPALVQARKDGAAEMGVHPAASLVALSAAAKNAASELSDPRTGDSEHGMRSFLCLMCKEYGRILSAPSDPKKGGSCRRQGNIETDSEETSSLPAYDSDAAIVARAVEQAAMSLFGAQQLKLDVLRACINICEALPDLGGVLRFSADALRTAGSGIAPGPESDNGSPMLPIEDQVRLANNISRTLSASQQLGLKILEAEYWDEFLVRGIELAELDPTRMPVPHAKAELEMVHAAEARAVKNPLIHNPFGNKTITKMAEPILVAGEDIMFRVTLQNLYDFDLEIEGITLEAEGIPFESFFVDTVIGPYRTQTMGLKGKPNAAGSLRVTGCKAKIKGCRERRFPLFAEPWSFKLDTTTEPRDFLPEESSQDAAHSESTDKPTEVKQYGPTASALSLKIIDTQPNVSLKSVSLPQCAAMLLEGETKTFTVTLQNLSSSVPVDLILISFKDSTTSQLQSALLDKNLRLAELYELELSATRNQPLRWLRTASDPEPTIQPGGTWTFSVEVFGRPGLSHGTIQVDFAHLGVARSETLSQFYTRQLLIPLAITVNASIDLIRNDLIPFTSDFAWHNQQRNSQASSTASSTSNSPETPTRPPLSRRRSKVENRFSALLSRLGLRSQDEEHVLLLLDLRNSWPNLLTTSIQVRQTNSLPDRPSNSEAWRRAYTVHETQQPGHTSRLVLILPRLYVQKPHAPLPSLNQSTKRQYIVSASGENNAEAELAAREAFWYREELLKHIRATWREESTGRSGSINLRSIRLSTRMVSALKLDDLAISFSVYPSPSLSKPEASVGVKQTSAHTFAIPTSTFLTLRTHLHNRSPEPIHPLLRLQPLLRHQPHNLALDLGKKFIWNGLLQRALPLLGAGDKTEVDVGFCILSEGEYEIGAAVEEVQILKAGSERSGHGEVEVEDLVLKGWKQGNRERRIWYANEACVMAAYDRHPGGM